MHNSIGQVRPPTLTYTGLETFYSLCCRQELNNLPHYKDHHAHQKPQAMQTIAWGFRLSNNIVGEIHESPTQLNPFIFAITLGEYETFPMRAIRESPLLRRNT